MTGKILVESKNPITQSPQAVETLAAFMHKKIEGGILDLGKVKLVKSSKGDAFYTTTERDCSCPARCYHPQRPCKHMRKFHSVAKVVARSPKTVPQAEMLVDAYAPETLPGEVEYWQKKGELELMNTVGFKPCLE
jgi:hypothetical protein